MSPRGKRKEKDTDPGSGAKEAKKAAGTEAATKVLEAAIGVDAEEEVVAKDPETASTASDMDTAAQEKEPGGEPDIAAEGQEKSVRKRRKSAEEKERSAKADTVAERKKGPKTNTVNLKALARDLYQVGLDLGLPPDEAALLTSETKLPAFINKEGEAEFKEGLIEGYQDMLDERVQNLKSQLGVA